MIARTAESNYYRRSRTKLEIRRVAINVTINRQAEKFKPIRAKTNYFIYLTRIHLVVVVYRTALISITREPDTDVSA